MVSCSPCHQCERMLEARGNRKFGLVHDLPPECRARHEPSTWHAEYVEEIMDSLSEEEFDTFLVKTTPQMTRFRDVQQAIIMATV